MKKKDNVEQEIDKIRFKTWDVMAFWEERPKGVKEASVLTLEAGATN